jgi:hypothetical protein
MGPSLDRRLERPDSIETRSDELLRRDAPGLDGRPRGHCTEILNAYAQLHTG